MTGRDIFTLVLFRAVVTVLKIVSISRTVWCVRERFMLVRKGWRMSCDDCGGSERRCGVDVVLGTGVRLWIDRCICYRDTGITAS